MLQLFDRARQRFNTVHCLHVVLVNAAQARFVDVHQIEEAAVALHAAAQPADNFVEPPTKTIELRQYIELACIDQRAAVRIEHPFGTLQTFRQPGALEGIGVAAIFLFPNTL